MDYRGAAMLGKLSRITPAGLAVGTVPALSLFLGALLGLMVTPPSIAAAQSSSDFDITVDINENYPYNVGYRGSSSAPEHGWRISIVANRTNVSDPDDHAYLNIQLLNNGSWTPYSSPAPMDINSITYDYPDFTMCDSGEWYYDQYHVQGYAYNPWSVSGRTYSLDSFIYTVVDNSSGTGSVALNDLMGNNSDIVCCPYAYTHCTGCYQWEDPDVAVTAIVYSDRHCE